MGDSVAEQGAQLRMLVLRLARKLRAEKADAAVSDAHYSVLSWLASSGAHTLRELAYREHVTSPSMNRTVNRLEAAGYIARHAHPDDGRKTTIALTSAGEDVVRETTEQRNAWLGQRLHELTPGERATLGSAAEILRRLSN